MRSAWTILVAAAALLPPQAGAAGFREQGSWQFRSAAETQVKLNVEAKRLELRRAGGAGGGTAVTLGGGAALAPGSGTGNQSGASALNAIDAAPGLTIEGSNNVVTVDGFLNLTVDQQADRARSRILNR